VDAAADTDFLFNFIDFTNSSNFVITIASADGSFSINAISSTTKCGYCLSSQDVMVITSINSSVVEDAVDISFYS
jgi:hypothetical protein